MNKYRNKPTMVDGVRFASKSEAVRDAELIKRRDKGEIRNIKRQPRFPLVVNGSKVCTYVPDWRYEEFEVEKGIVKDIITVCEDRKGVLTPAFKIKFALAKALFPNIEWRLS